MRFFKTFGMSLSVFEGPSDKWLIVSSNMAIIVNGVITLDLFYPKIIPQQCTKRTVYD